MRKQDYSTLAQIFRTDLESLNKQLENQILAGLQDSCTGEAFENTFKATKLLESKIAHTKLIAHSCAMKLSVDRKLFLSECGIYSGSVFD